MKKRVLWLSDFNCASGFATVAHNLLEQLLKTGKFNFEVVGINHSGEPYDFSRWPFPVYPAIDWTRAKKDRRYSDPFGRQRFLDLLGQGRFDIAFTLQDAVNMVPIARSIKDLQKQLGFSWIFYYPVDGKLRDNWVNNGVLLADQPVAYTQYGRNETLRVNPVANPKVIYHGINLGHFFPLDDGGAFRTAYFGQNARKFIVTNVNRNQPRKDIGRTIAAFARFRAQRPESLLYLHMSPSDLGGSIIEMARYWGLELDKDFMLPESLDEVQGYPVDILNRIYNASDVVVSTSLGEGWGLSVTEAMATKTPVIIPDHTALSEIGAEGRARLVKNGREFVCIGAADFSQFRPLTDCDDLVAALIECHDHRENFREMTERAYNWVVNLSWERIGQQWLEIFDSVPTQC